VSLWREIAKKGVTELVDDASDEEKARAAARRKRKIAFGVVAISALGLLALSGVLTAIFKWVLGFAFVAGLIAGGWYLVRNRFRAIAASMSQKPERASEEKKAESDGAKSKSPEAQLAELKRKMSEKDD
jgi:hypothetical protein